MHGMDWDGCEDLKGWWLSEKFDGVRSFWDGGSMISRNGRRIFCPHWFTENFPTGVTLDGELWIERGELELLNGTLKSNKDDPAWKAVSFMVFDLPSSKEPYEKRIHDLKELNLPNHV